MLKSIIGSMAQKRGFVSIERRSTLFQIRLLFAFSVPHVELWTYAMGIDDFRFPNFVGLVFRRLRLSVVLIQDEKEEKRGRIESYIKAKQLKRHYSRRNTKHNTNAHYLYTIVSNSNNTKHNRQLHLIEPKRSSTCRNILAYISLPCQSQFTHQLVT